MFVPMKVNEFWGSVDGFPSDAWFYGNGWEKTLRPYYCETSKKWVLVWQKPTYQQSLRLMAEYFPVLKEPSFTDGVKRFCYQVDTSKFSQYVNLVINNNSVRPTPQPILLWVMNEYDRHVMDIILERADPYHESNFSVWEKYPEIAKDACYAVAHKFLLTNKRTNKYLYQNEKNTTAIGASEYSNLITRYSFFQQEMAGLMVSFAATLSLRKRKIQQSTAFGRCVNSGSGLSKMEFFPHQAAAIERIAQSSGRTPNLPYCSG